MIIASNWKMHLDPDEARALVLEMEKQIPKEDQDSFIFCAGALLFGAIAPLFSKNRFHLGGQNSWIEGEGPFTGENSPQILRQLGAEFCLVGHSERRRLFFEDEELIQKKIKAMEKFKLIPILCVGESFNQKKEGSMERVLKEQLQPALQAQNILIAYEPQWAIGSGKRAGAAHIAQALSVIKSLLKNKVLYGGSVSEDNVQPLAQIPGVDGFLVGSKSLKASSLIGLYKKIKGQKS